MGSLRALRKVTGAALCLECGKCSTMCPLAQFGEFSAARMMSMHEPESEMGEYGEAVDGCLTCASCELRCPQGVRYTEYVRGLRQILPAHHRQPRPHGEVFQVAAKLPANGRSWPPAWLSGDLEVADEGEIGLFVGCLPLFDAVFQSQFPVETVQIARAAIRLLNHLGVVPVLLDSERCCGHDLLWSGEEESFETLARENIQRFQERGVRHLVTACAECCRTWRIDYPRVDDDFRLQVEHMVEFLVTRLGDAELSFEDATDGAVTYQDPCRLGRHLGVFEAPRDLLQHVPGIELLEMERSRENALCCGTSGFIRCDSASRRLQSQRLQGAAATGAGRLLTSCPKCLIHLRCAQAEDRRRGEQGCTIEVEDLTVFLADHLSPPGARSQSDSDSITATGENP